MNIFATLPPADAKVEAVFRYMDTLPYSERQAYLANNLNCKVQRLYKYRPLDPASADSISRVHDIIVAGRLWLSSPLDFNDPFDLTAQSVFEGTREEKKARLQILIDEKAANLSPRKRREMVAKILAQPIDAMTANVHDASTRSMESCGLYCLAGDPLSILMWSHYGHHHTGICLRFDVAKDPTSMTAAVPVKYTTEYPVINWPLNGTETLRDALYSKFADWRYEQEYRIMVPDGRHKYLPIKPEAVDSIILGCRATTDTQAAVEKSLMNEFAENCRRWNCTAQRGTTENTNL